MKRSKLQLFALTSLGGLVILALMFGLMLGAIALDDSPNKCASKVASKVYDPKCF
ncbi:hypothetical protein SEA_ANNADREAMY_246 [Streptomyces phage Annadreamy]|uniref:Uncharacterized protein n=2 Tax=Annadreamyvirus annadreamy TaxID=2846392 RepID=A0A345GTQ3_9CAUD|nr:hypothetical protein HWB75_gp033 [Streptomyces phage Annadreamy]AXG66325.1 hypothetical protein SEA_ANNADREAMY_246 [Streptomyces phage Annadreamy]QGH79553.1 hypothetical protein SEA_LIMPID_252 [Streptomyces phage Limpid]